LKKYNFLKLQAGFSIMEVMIAAGLLGIVTVGVLQVTKNMTKSSKTDAQRVEFAQVTNQIQSLLRDEYSCEATLSGLSPSGGGSTFPSFKRKKPDGTTSSVLTSGQVYGTGGTPIFLKKMEIKNYNASSGIAELWVTMNKGRKDFDSMTMAEKQSVGDTSYGTAVVPKVLKVQVILDGAGNIKDCISDKDDYTSGACAMINGDWADKVNCKSIKVDGNGIDPSITARTHMQVNSGLNVGSTLSGDPGNGAVKISSNLDVGDKATVKNDTTITSGKLIFNDGDARINQVAGNNLYIENKAGTAGANIIAGKSGVARTTVTPSSVTINKNGTIGTGLALEVIGNTTLTGSGSTSVTLKVGNADIQYNGTNLVLNKPTGGVVQYKDGSTIEEVASQGFVNAQLGKALTGDPTTLTTILTNLGTLVSGSPVQAIAATTCGFYTNMTWNGTRCVDNRTTNCTGNNRVNGFNNGVINCQPIVAVNQRCSIGQLYMGHDSNGVAICSNANNEIGAWVDGKIFDAAADAAASGTCASKGTGGWFDKGSGGGRGACRWSYNTGGSSFWTGCGSGCPGGSSYFDYCHWDGGSCGAAGCCPDTCGWAGSNHDACTWPVVTHNCWCTLSNDGKSCPGSNCT
jgi:type II secretory pathway pseudopilin PulG